MMRSARTSLGVAAGAFAATMAWSSAAVAHIEIVLPESRYGPDMIKDAPCGHPDNPPGVAPPHVYQTGETITIVVDEYIAHEGHLRIAWAENDEDFVTVGAFDDFDNFPGVLMDNIIDPPGMKQFTIELTLPAQECDNCTLQVIQVMYDGDGFQEEDLYYTCADITLLDVVPGAGDDTAGMGSGAGDGGGVTGADDMGDAAGASTDGSDGNGTDGTGGGGADGSGDDGGCSIGRQRDAPVGWLALGAMMLGMRRRSRCTTIAPCARSEA